MLMNHGDALAPGIGATQDRGLDTIFQDPTAVRWMDPAKDLNQGALPCPILAGEGMHLSGIKAEIDGTQNLDGSKALCDPPKFNDRRHHTYPELKMFELPAGANVSECPSVSLMEAISGRYEQARGCNSPEYIPAPSNNG
jgi:hypothetical protein